MTESTVTSGPGVAGEEVVLSTVDASVHYGGVKALDGVSLELAAGRIFGALGPNGSGKSTLLAAITRLVPLTRGSLHLGTEDISRLRASDLAGRGVARTFQTARLVMNLNVRDNVLMATDRSTQGRSESAAYAEHCMEIVGVAHHARSYPAELSYGTQRRVEIARALAARPRILLLDEPTAGMNQHERHQISELLQQLRAGGLTQFLVEHDVQMMVDTCDYLFAMNFGKLIAQGVPREVVRHPQVREAYLGKRWREYARD